MDMKIFSIVETKIDPYDMTPSGLQPKITSEIGTDETLKYVRSRVGFYIGDGYQMMQYEIRTLGRESASGRDTFGAMMNLFKGLDVTSVYACMQKDGVIVTISMAHSKMPKLGE